MKIFFEILHKENILSKKGVNSKKISALSPTQLKDLCEKLINITKDYSLKAEQKKFTHTASLSLGGGIEDCMNLSCRIKNLDSLARFAVMYSDKVYIDNFLTRNIHDEKIMKVHIESIKKDFYNDIYLLTFIQPLLENGNISLFTSPKYCCPFCLAASAFGESSRKRLDKARRELEEKYLLNTTIKYRYIDNQYELECIGAQPYFEHGGIVYSKGPYNDILLSIPSVGKRIKKVKEVVLSKAIKEKLMTHKNFAEQALRNICFELIVTQENNTSFLTNKDLHLSLLKDISDNPNVEERNKISYDNLTTVVPFLEDVELKNLIKLRNREYGSFVGFRQALNSAVDEFRGKRGKFTTKDARNLYFDVINPQLVSLERKINDAKKDLLTKSYRNVLACVGAISFGLYFGFIPTELKAMASSIGLIKFGTDFLKDIMAGSDIEKNIRNDNLFFLWKAKRLAKIPRKV